jgi:hypothetical protein
MVLETLRFLLNKTIDKRPSLVCLKDNNFKIEDKQIIFEVESKAEQKLLLEEEANLLSSLEQYGYKGYNISLLMIEKTINLKERKAEKNGSKSRAKRARSNYLWRKN